VHIDKYYFFSLTQRVSLYIIDEIQAKEIAREFLQQHYSVIKTEMPVLKEGAWLVEAWVSAPHTKKFQIKISSKTGQIMEFFRIKN